MNPPDRLVQIVEYLNNLSEDSSVPRNIRRGATEAKSLLERNDKPMDVRKASAIFLLDELANDPNIPLHGRTTIWNLIRELETL